MIYDLYHDESTVAGYWHGMLLVPDATRDLLLGELNNVRRNLNHDEPINLKGLNKRSGKQYRSVQAWLTICVCALVQKLKGDTCPYTTGKITRDSSGMRRVEYLTLRKKIGAKFILFRVRDGHASLYDSMDYAARVETTLRMGLKGGMHLLGTTEEPIHIRSFHFDGHEHLGRHVDLSRIVDRITGLREYCSFAKPLLLDDRGSDHRKNDSQALDDCQLLQLTDLIVGAFRTLLGQCTNDIQKDVSSPISKLLDSWGRGYAGMSYSRWFRGFCVSQCYLENEEWQFKDIENKKDVPAEPTLFDDIVH